MAPISEIPGRLRLENCELIGKRYCCMALTNKINAVNGVRKTDINPRTGRILIIFDDMCLKSDDLILKVNEFLNGMKSEQCTKTYMTMEIRNDKTRHLYAGKNEKSIGDDFIRAAVNIAGKALLPKPLGILLSFISH